MRQVLVRSYPKIDTAIWARGDSERGLRTVLEIETSTCKGGLSMGTCASCQGSGKKRCMNDHSQICLVCGGSGFFACLTCKGTGQVAGEGWQPTGKVCWQCKGTGRRNYRGSGIMIDCDVCEGAGYL